MPPEQALPEAASLFQTGKPLRKRVGFWLLMVLVVAPMFAAVAGIAIAGLTVASASSSDAPRASESQTTSTTTPKTPTTTRPRTTTTTRPRPATTQDNVDWDGVAAALDRWPGVYGEALSDVWDTTNCEDLAFDVQFAMDYLTFPNQAQADSFTTDLALVAYSRAQRINCTLSTIEVCLGKGPMLGRPSMFAMYLSQSLRTLGSPS